jgi:hypothetical protein
MEMIMSRLDDVFWSGVLVLTVLFLVLSPGGSGSRNKPTEL